MQDSNLEIDASRRATSAIDGCWIDQRGGDPPAVADSQELNIVVADIDAARPHISPVVLSGPSGCGKSRLLRGLVARQLRRWGPGTASYTTALRFARQRRAARSVAALRAFRKQLSDVRLWALDDLDRLPRSQSVQCELSASIDALAERGAWIVVATSSGGNSSARLLPALSDRLQAGLSVPVAPPAPQGLNRQAATRALATRHATAHEPRSDAGSSPRQIVSIVAKYFGIPLAQLRGRSRQTSTVRARAIAMYLLRTVRGQTYSQIGPLVGGRDHTTVMHHCRKIEQLLTADEATRQAVDDLQRIILGSA